MNKQIEAMKLALEAMKLALEALQSSQQYVEACANAKTKAGWGEQLDVAEDAITALRAAQQDIPDLIAGALGVSRGTAYDMMLEALAEQSAQQEPVACVHIKDGCLVGSHRDQSTPFPDGQYGLWPIDTRPQAREPLPDDEFISMVDSTGLVIDPELAFEIKEMVEAAHGIKE